jgi:hypothetical protein
LVLLISALFSLAGLLATTSPQGVNAQGGKPTQSSKPAVFFEIDQGSPRPGTNDPEQPIIRVTAKKNKQIYDTVETSEGGLRFLFKVRGRCGKEGSKDNLDWATIKVSSYGKAAGTESFPVNKSHRSMGPNHGEGWNYHTLDYPNVHPISQPVQACNNEVKRRESKGESQAGLLQHGFNVDLGIAYLAEMNVVCMQHQPGIFVDTPSLIYKARTGLRVQLQCMPTGYVPTTGAPPRHGVHLDPPITNVALKAEPAEMKGHACPVYVGFRGQITAGENRPGNDPVKIKYRFVGDRGFDTPFYDETLRKGETKAVFWKRRIEALPIVGGPDKVLAPGVKPKIPIYQGWTTLEVVYPGADKKSSQKATFTVDCNPGGPRM